MSRFQAILAFFAICAAAFFANLLFSVTNIRADFTQDHTFTLSPGSRRIIARLDEPVTLEFFASRSDVKLRPYLESYSRRIETLLREYVAHSGGKIKLVITDPRPDTKEEQRAQRQSLGAMRAAQGSAYLGLTAQQADTVKAIPVLDPSREKFLEFDLSKLIASVARLDKPKLAIISSLAITNQVPQGEQQQPGPADFLLAELGQTFEVITLSNQATELPKDTAVIALIHPNHLAEKLSYAVDQFLLNGGPVFAAVDPLSRLQKFQQGGMPFMMAPMALGASSDPLLLRGWGINVDIDVVVGDASNSVAIRGSRGEPVQYQPAFSVTGDAFDKDSPLTSVLHEIAFMEPGDISLISGAEKRLTLVPLITLSSPGAGVIGTALANAGPFEKVALGFKPDGKSRVLVASITGTFNSAYPKGAPAESPAAPDAPKSATPPVAAPAAPHLTESKKPGRLMVVADSDFMLDPFTVRQRQASGQVAMEAINDNLAFVLSALETLGGSDELVSLRSKGTSIRPFKRVVALEREAQVRYQAKLDEIEKRLEDANGKIAEISKRSGTDNSKGLIITPEMQREIEKFQAEAEKLTDERRVIRRGLSEDVNSLGRRLQVINLLAGPAIAALFGLLYTLVRRRKIA
ncbi:MAG: GldG family protein [Verrucomicrobiota bacterium]